MTAEDSGELIAAARYLGVPHPPGYPLWTMLCGGFMRIVPVGSFAWRANLFSAACCSAAAALILYGALRELRIQRPIAAAAALVWVLGRWSWSQSVIAEVYSLNSLLTAGLLWCMLRWYRTRNDAPHCLLRHCCSAWECPITTRSDWRPWLSALWALILQPSLLKRWRTVLASIALFLIGLLPYAYLPLRAKAEPPINWGNPSTVESFWAHVSRHQYGAIGPTKAAEPHSFRRLADQLAYLAEAVADDLTIWLALIGLAGVILLAVCRRDLFLLVILWLLCTGILFVVLANFDLDRTSGGSCGVFLIPVSLGLVIPMALLLQRLAELIQVRFAGAARRCLYPGRLHRRSRPSRANRKPLETVRLLQLLVRARSRRRICSECMMPQAMIFPPSDHNTFPMVYLHLVEKQRRDILIGNLYGFVDPTLYRDRPESDPDSPMAWLIKHARRPVYFMTKQALAGVQRNTNPIGPCSITCCRRVNRSTLPASSKHALPQSSRGDCA